MLACTVDAECNDGEHYVANQCAPAACGSGFFDCVAGDVCAADLVCHATCQSDDDCAQFQTCDFTLTGNPDTGGCNAHSCTSNSDCPFGTVCRDLTCQLPPVDAAGATAAIWVLFATRAP